MIWRLTLPNSTRPLSPSVEHTPRPKCWRNSRQHNTQCISGGLHLEEQLRAQKPKGRKCKNPLRRITQLEQAREGVTIGLCRCPIFLTPHTFMLTIKRRVGVNSAPLLSSTQATKSSSKFEPAPSARHRDECVMAVDCG